MVSLNPARAVGIADETGSLAVGKSADLVVVRNGGAFPQVERTFVYGREVFCSC